MARILVIDDEPTVRFLIVKALEMAGRGYEIEHVDTARDGLERLEAAPFDLVITDLFMPDMDGIETIMAIKKAYPGLKVIAVSAGGAEVLEPARLLGAVRTLRKPFAREDLIAMVDRIFAGT